jgi:hypothetical protein
MNEPQIETKKEWLRRIARAGGDLWCSFCPPNRGENKKHKNENGWKRKRKTKFRRIKDL